MNEPILDHVNIELLDKLRRRVAKRKPFIMAKLIAQMGTPKGIQRFIDTVGRYNCVNIQQWGRFFTVAYTLEMGHPGGADMKHVSVWSKDKDIIVPPPFGMAIAEALGVIIADEFCGVENHMSADGYLVFNVFQPITLNQEGGRA